MTSDKMYKNLHDTMNRIEDKILIDLDAIVQEIFIEQYVKMTPTFATQIVYGSGYKQAIKDLYKALVGAEFPESKAQTKATK